MGKPTFASDLYSLGVTCIHLLTNIEPFDLFDSSECDWVWRDYLTVKVNNTLGQVLDKLLQQGTKKRFQTAQEVLDALQLTVKPTPQPTPQPTPEPNIELKSVIWVVLKSVWGVRFLVLGVGISSLASRLVDCNI